MRTTIVPAQITSVEDRITGNLSFKQLLLMITPVFMSMALFICLPPFAGYKVYKVVISVVIAVICLGLALRIKGRLVIDWAMILSRYNLRPTYFVYNKNNSTARTVIAKKHARPAEQSEPQKAKSPMPQFVYNTGDEMSFEERLINPAANLHFTFSKKGGLRVHVKEIK